VHPGRSAWLLATDGLITAGADPHARDEQYDATPLGWAQTAVQVTSNQDCAVVARGLRSLEPQGPPSRT
jgi:hypothetical protein